MIDIKDDAIFIADSHCNKNRQELKIFLLKLQSNEIKTNQLFLMGDIFDFLAPQIKYFVHKNKEIINLINNISNTIDIVYLEGNHDYNLKDLFPNVDVIRRQNQPVNCKYKDKYIALAHGDIFTPTAYNIYTSIIRNNIFLHLLNFIDINNWLTKKIDKWLLSKNICGSCEDFKRFSKSRIALYDKKIDLIIEGHFHYGEQNNNYVNIPSLSCSKQYYTFKTKHFSNI